MDKSILYALIAAICYGLGSPFFKMASNNGASGAGVSLMYGIAATLLCYFGGQTTFFGTGKGFAFASMTGLAFGIALFMVSKAVAMPTGYVSLIGVIVAAYPLISTAIGLVFLSEADKFKLTPLLIGSALVVAGLALITMSAKDGGH